MSEAFDAKLAENYYNLFTSMNGRRVLDDLEEKHLHRSSVVDQFGGYYEPHVVQSLEGERRVLIRIKEMMELGDQVSRGNSRIS